MKIQINLGIDELNHKIDLDIIESKHILYAGVTGSGKSSFIHKCITACSSFSPENISLCLIDTKQLELNRYNSLPHLLTQVITDIKKSVFALRWLKQEIDRRLETFQTLHIRSYEEYKGKEKLPRIIFIVDGFTDIVQQFPREVSQSCQKILELGHIVGVHLIITSNQVTPKTLPLSILNYIPTVISGKLASKLESKHILGQNGAETLQIPNQILFRSNKMKFPICIHTDLIEDKEIEKAIEYTKKYKKTPANMSSVDYEDDVDDMFNAVRDDVIESGKASTSYIQRKFGIGYSRAARLVDLLEQNGIVGPARGSEPRRVIERCG